MLWRLLRQSWRRNIRRKSLAVLTVFLAAGLISALLAVSIDIGDKMARELKSYGANILIEPAGQAALPALFGERSNPLEGQDFLDEAELPNIKDIFWRNNIVGFAPLLSGDVEIKGQPIAVLGTFFSQPVAVPDEEDYRTGQMTVSPYWQVAGQWPQEPVTTENVAQALVGKQLATQTGWKVGDKLALHGAKGDATVEISGILSSGGDEEGRLVMPLATVQSLLGLAGKIQAIRVSALTVPENELSRRARENLEALNAEEYDLWYCTAYVSSIAHQLEEAISGSVAAPHLAGGGVGRRGDRQDSTATGGGDLRGAGGFCNGDRLADDQHHHGACQRDRADESTGCTSVADHAAVLSRSGAERAGRRYRGLCRRLGAGKSDWPDAVWRTVEFRVDRHPLCAGYIDADRHHRNVVPGETHCQTVSGGGAVWALMAG